MHIGRRRGEGRGGRSTQRLGGGGRERSSRRGGSGGGGAGRAGGFGSLLNKYFGAASRFMTKFSISGLCARAAAARRSTDSGGAAAAGPTSGGAVALGGGGPPAGMTRGGSGIGGWDSETGAGDAKGADVGGGTGVVLDTSMTVASSSFRVSALPLRSGSERGREPGGGWKVFASAVAGSGGTLAARNWITSQTSGSGSRLPLPGERSGRHAGRAAVCAVPGLQRATAAVAAEAGHGEGSGLDEGPRRGADGGQKVPRQAVPPGLECLAVRRGKPRVERLGLGRGMPGRAGLSPELAKAEKPEKEWMVLAVGGG
ncbi:hypothetical protein Efla_002886 [Eimeria flavescens]